jgi:hypothetical protein
MPASMNAMARSEAAQQDRPAAVESRGVWRYWIAGGGVMLIAAMAEFAMGRHLWGIGGTAGLWSGNVLSPHNSQFVADPYSFTHITHGILIYAILRVAFAPRSLAERSLLALALESGWEVLENTDFVIQRYRAATISLHYFGDSIVNSMGDVLFMMAGFWIASRLSTRATIVIAVALEIILAWWIHDNLLLNLIMLIHPIPAIKAWQNGVS